MKIQYNDKKGRQRILGDFVLCKMLRLVLLLSAMFLSGCSEQAINKVVKESRNGCLTIDYAEALKLKSENMPLSELVDSFRFVRLENSEKAFVGGEFWGSASYGDYIKVKSYNVSAVRLYTKFGKYMAEMGAIGQGPGEYCSAYDFYLDGKKQIFYLAPFDARQIFAYDLSGRYLPEESIPFPGKAVIPKCRFWIDFNKKQVTVAILPFKVENPASPLDKLCWVQDFKGNIVKSISAKGHQLLPDYSNEVVGNYTPPNISFSIFDWNHTRPDTLFHYNTEKNQLEPVLSVDFKSMKQTDAL